MSFRRPINHFFRLIRHIYDAKLTSIPFTSIISSFKCSSPVDSASAPGNNRLINIPFKRTKPPNRVNRVVDPKHNYSYICSYEKRTTISNVESKRFMYIVFVETYTSLCFGQLFSIDNCRYRKKESNEIYINLNKSFYFSKIRWI